MTGEQRADRTHLRSLLSLYSALWHNYRAGQHSVLCRHSGRAPVTSHTPNTQRPNPHQPLEPAPHDAPRHGALVRTRGKRLRPEAERDTSRAFRSRTPVALLNQRSGPRFLTSHLRRALLHRASRCVEDCRTSSERVGPSPWDAMTAPPQLCQWVGR